MTDDQDPRLFPTEKWGEGSQSHLHMSSKGFDTEHATRLGRSRPQAYRIRDRHLAYHPAASGRHVDGLEFQRLPCDKLHSTSFDRV